MLFSSRSTSAFSTGCPLTATEPPTSSAINTVSSSSALWVMLGPARRPMRRVFLYVMAEISLLSQDTAGRRQPPEFMPNSILQITIFHSLLWDNCHQTYKPQHDVKIRAREWTPPVFSSSPAPLVLPAGLSSERSVVVLCGADDVTLVLQELQHLPQHSFTQAWAEAQVSTGQDVQEVAALLHVCRKKGVG